MPDKRKRSKSAKGESEVWVSPDLMLKLKGAEGNRGVPLPQSPYLVLADRFLGLVQADGASPRHRAATTHAGHKSRENVAAPEPPRRVIAASAAAGAGSEGVLSSIPPRMLYPKPPLRPASPKPPKLSLSRPPARPNLPKLKPPKPPKLSFGYLRRKDAK